MSFANDLPLDSLPTVRGSYNFDLPLSRITWFKVGGLARVVFTPEDTDDLCDFLKNKPKDVAILVVGMGSNILIRDGGFDGIVIRLNKLKTINIDGNSMTVGAGAGDLITAREAAKAHISGFEFLSGIPGTIGGALRMNAGAYGRETKDIFVSCRAVDSGGTVHTLSHDDMGFRYRHCVIPNDWIFLDAVFKGTLETEPHKINAIAERMDDIQNKRTESQPTKARTGGSTFKNPKEKSNQKSAWQLVDEAGMRGYTLGGAQVSEKHCNFLINTGNATAKDLEDLGELVREKVLQNSGIQLQWEIKRIGNSQ